MVDSTLSYAAAVWAPGLALDAARRPVVRGASGSQSSPSEAEDQHHSFLRRLTGLPTRTPLPTVLAEAGQPPLYISWLASSARLWGSLLAAPEGSLMGTVLEASLQMAAEWGSVPAQRLPRGHLPWALQLQRAMAAAGVDFDPQQRAPLVQAEVRQAALQHHLQRVAVAAQRPGASRMRHYFVAVRPDCLEVAGYTLPAYVTEIRERHRRIALAEIRSGVHGGAEERERLQGVHRRPTAERECMHCAARGLLGRAEDAHHILFECVHATWLTETSVPCIPGCSPQSSRQRCARHWRPSWRARACRWPGSSARADGAAGAPSGCPPSLSSMHAAAADAASPQHGQLPQQFSTCGC